MAEITTTQSFSDGDTVTATKLNNIQANASVQPEAITNRTAETTIDQANDLLLIYDASATALKKVTPSDLIKSGTASNFPITGNATIGGTLGVTGNSTLSGTLGVTGTSTLTGAITATSTINGTTIPTTKTLVTTVDTQTLTNKTLTTPIISSISNTGTLTLPTATDTIVGRATTDTLTNKTLASPSISDPTITGAITASTSTINVGSGQIYKDASGNVGIGTNSPSYRLHINSGANQPALFESSAVVSVAYFKDAGTSSTPYCGSSGNNFYIGTNATERLRIDSSGNLLVGTTSVIGNGKITVQANLGSGNGINIDDSSSSSGGVFARFSIGAGTLCGFISRNAATSAVLYNTSSDYRLKENVQPMIGALAKVSALKPCTWTWKEAGQAGEGFIAHEIQEIVPSAVSGNKDETYPDGTPKHQGMDASYLVATLTAAIQEQQAIITSLTERITALEAA